MITKIFKISTKELWVLKNKQELILFIEQECNIYVSNKFTIIQLLRILPVENYSIIKKGDI